MVGMAQNRASTMHMTSGIDALRHVCEQTMDTQLLSSINIDLAA